MLLQRTAKSDIWSERNPRRLTRLKLAGRRHHHYTTTAHVGGRGRRRQIRANVDFFFVSQADKRHFCLHSFNWVAMAPSVKF